MEAVPGWDALPEFGGIGVDVCTLASRYLRERVARHELSRKTATNTNNVLRAFGYFIGNPPVARVRRKHVERWVEHRLSQVAPVTVVGDLSMLRTFCRWLLLNRQIRTDPTLGVSAPRRPRRLPRNLATAAVAALLAATPDARGELMVSLMVQEGLRCMEVAGLELGDIDAERRLMLVKGKGDKERVVPMTSGTWTILSRYLDDYPASSGPVVRSYVRPNMGLHPKTVSALVTRWMTDAGVKRRPRDGRSAHALRHTAATDVLDGGADIREVKEMLGHASLSATQVYLGWSVQNLRAAMEGRDYRAQAGSPNADKPVRPPLGTRNASRPGGGRATEDMPQSHTNGRAADAAPPNGRWAEPGQPAQLSGSGGPPRLPNANEAPAETGARWEEP